MPSKQAILQAARQLPAGALVAFAIKQAWAAIFGGALLAAIIFTNYVELPWLARYDWLFLFALAVQGILLVTRLEKPHEVLTILVFHLVGLGMEVFKTSALIGSWAYPGESFFHLGAVPLFSGFMYAAVGSYIARSWRVMDFGFTGYPKRLWTVLLALAVYTNFFSHHFAFDIRWILVGAVLLLYGRTWVHYVVNRRTRRMPLALGFALVAVFIWLAENIATFTSIWLYPSQVGGWQPVGIDKFVSWFLLMIISFIMIDLLHYHRHIRSKRDGSVIRL